MKISDAIARLTAIQEHFGDLSIAGGYMTDDRPLDTISVVNQQDGVEIEDDDEVRPRQDLIVFLSI